MTNRPKSQLLSALQSAAPRVVPPGWLSLFDAFELMGKAKYEDQWTSGQIVLDDNEKITFEEFLELRTNTRTITKAPPPPSPVGQFQVTHRGGEPSIIDGPKAIEERGHEVIWTDRIHALWDELRAWLYGSRVGAQGLLSHGRLVDFPKQTWMREDVQSVPEDGKLPFFWVRRNRNYRAILLIKDKSLRNWINGKGHFSTASGLPASVWPKYLPHVEWIEEAKRIIEKDGSILKEGDVVTRLARRIKRRLHTTQEAETIRGVLSRNRRLWHPH